MPPWAGFHGRPVEAPAAAKRGWRNDRMTNVLERLGVKSVINACGPVTRLGGGVMHPDVAAAMTEASQVSVVSLSG
jgi:seryl-tRNA(Sec) selenium transferase